MNAPAALAFHVPPALLAAALGFWGWQTRNGYAAAGFALVMLLPALTRLRLELSERDQHRISDLTMILYVAVAASLIGTEGLRAGVHESLVWLPGVVLPLLLAQTMCVEGRFPMSALFRYLRKMKARGERVADPRIDLSGAYLALILIAAGMANQPGHGYFAGVALIIAAGLIRIKPSRVSIAAWLTALTFSIAAGFALHSGLYTLQTIVEDWIIDWQFSVPVSDPYRSSTRIGELGRLKFEDAIILRVYAGADGRDKPELLHSASYNHYAGTTWLARGGSLDPLRASGDGSVFLLGSPGSASSVTNTAANTAARTTANTASSAAANTASSTASSTDASTDANATASAASEATPRVEPSLRLRLSQKVQSGRALLALPSKSIAISELVASRVRSNSFGAVQAEMEVPWTFHTAIYNPLAPQAALGYAPADAGDLEVPPHERPALEALVQRLGLGGIAPAEAARRVKEYLAGFEYSTVRNKPFSDLLPGSETPLAEFLNTTRRGHCEYFASASTLLLRAAGIPARYATGFAVEDWSAWEGAWIVRERHAHAWTRAFINGQWRDIDTTPPVWFAEEEALAPLGQKLVDFLRWAGFRWSTRDDGDTRVLAWVVVGLAAMIMVWKLVTEGGLVRLAERGRASATARPGEDSEFFAVEASLARHVPRATGEALLDWLPRAARNLEANTRADLNEAASLHYRYRFDPLGLDAGARTLLAARCRSLLESLRQNRR